ncbi:hypothetical protein TVAG_008900 [Trichomonas vaginalis G3]|uniref:Uncharacterized protein n=1 Tax=Trichomonas vaginalis (strain ATCC PRA-98 / G3) TaxID=412133 RepID=A2FGT5_TRIV3|nr:armadillo (ARM) repeat-containing protein family [Trichomonas vaginalis G3]EAX95879.1 hypothetical protein TVAG_008900 [Trichomonas vaginalis G3]KAI5528794.1 armadillo (ARM) repeat-containing protein family [Trichomonas vaginalis G3]|eukprot:XP_001308809.1 hypothetical protein [Trichomonas vaginalis G3]
MLASMFVNTVEIDESFGTYKLPSIILTIATSGDSQLETSALTLLVNIFASKQPYYRDYFSPEDMQLLFDFIIKNRINKTNYVFKILLIIMDKNSDFSINYFANIPKETLVEASLAISRSAATDRYNESLMSNLIIRFIERVINIMPIEEYFETLGMIINDGLRFLDLTHPHMTDFFNLLDLISENENFKDLDSKYQFGYYINHNMFQIPDDLIIPALNVLAASSLSVDKIDINQLVNLCANSDVDIQQTAFFAIGKLIFNHSELAAKFYEVFSLDLLTNIESYSSKIKLEIIYIMTAFAIYCDSAARLEMIDAGLIDELLEYIELSDFSVEIANSLILLLKTKMDIDGAQVTLDFINEHDIIEILENINEESNDEKFHAEFDLFVSIFDPN